MYEEVLYSDREHGGLLGDYFGNHATVGVAKRPKGRFLKQDRVNKKIKERIALTEVSSLSSSFNISQQTSHSRDKKHDHFLSNLTSTSSSIHRCDHSTQLLGAHSRNRINSVITIKPNLVSR